MYKKTATVVFNMKIRKNRIKNGKQKSLSFQLLVVLLLVSVLLQLFRNIIYHSVRHCFTVHRSIVDINGIFSVAPETLYASFHFYRLQTHFDLLLVKNIVHFLLAYRVTVLKIAHSLLDLLSIRKVFKHFNAESHSIKSNFMPKNISLLDFNKCE